MRILLVIVLLGLQSCAFVHHVQVGEIEYRKGYDKKPFELRVSETGVDFQEAGALAAGLSGGSKAGNSMKEVADIIALFQMGPRTGKPIFNENYSDSLAKAIYGKCPSGNITNLVMIREMNSYPVVSGEIVKITGSCLTKRSNTKGKL